MIALVVITLLALQQEVAGALPQESDTRQFLESGRTKLANGDPDGAIEDFQKALSLSPRSAEALNGKGVALSMKGQLQEAIEDFNKALDVDPGYAKAIYNRGRVRYLKGEYESCLKDLSKTISLVPDDAWAYYFRAKAHEQCDSLEKALSDYDKSISLNSKVGRFHWDRGVAKSKLGQFVSGIADLTTALEIGERKDSYQILADRARLHAMNNDHRAALADCDSSITLKPASARSLAQRSMVKLFLKDGKGALADARKAVDLSPDFGQAHVMSCLANYQLRQWKDALADITKSESLLEGPTKARAQLMTWLIRMKMGQPDVARHELKKLVESSLSVKELRVYAWIGQYLQGDLPTQEFRESVKEWPLAHDEEKSICIIYEGMKMLIDGKDDISKSILSQCKKLGFTYFPEFVLAINELDGVETR